MGKKTKKDYIFWRSEIKERLDSVYADSPPSRGSYPAWNFGHEKAVGAMGAAFAHSGQQTQPCDHFRAQFEWVGFVTVDETWIHWYTPENKEQSKQWTSPGEHAPKKAKTVPSAGKVMATFFWDSQGVIYIDYLETYADLLGRFAAELQKIRPHLAKKKALFDKAKLVELGFELLSHCYFFSFPNLKKSLLGYFHCRKYYFLEFLYGFAAV